jgi:hypothetical protein
MATHWLVQLIVFISSMPGSSPESALPPVCAVAARLDAAIASGYAPRGLVPSPRADECDLLRRLSLDLRGTVPSADEVLAYLDDPSPEKWAARVDAALASPEHKDYFARLFTDTLLGLGANRDVLQEVLQEWLEDAFEKNRPWNTVVRDILLDRGVAQESGPANFLIKWGTTPEELAGTTARVFLGLQIQCAQCHDHPNGEWTRQDFYGYAAFFGRTKLVPMRVGTAVRDYRITDRARGEAYMDEGLEKVKVSPRFLRGEPYADSRSRTRREALADFVVAPENPWFARAFVNRLAGLLFGRGFVDPVDDFSSENQPSHAEALDLLAADFVASGFDVRRAIAVIVNSGTYRLSSRTVPGNERDFDGFSHAQLRPLNPHQIFGAVVSAMGLAADDPAFERLVNERVRAGVRHSELRQDPDADAEDLLALMDSSKVCGARKGRPPLPAMVHIRTAFLAQVRSAQGADDPDVRLDESIAKALLLLNGELIDAALKSEPADAETARRVFDRVAAENVPVERKVERLYLAALSRRPSRSESERAIAAIGGESAGVTALADLFWGLVNSAEFGFNH